MVACECKDVHERKRVVLTGGPGAGKTASLELIRQSFCSHVRILESIGDSHNPAIVLCDRGTIDGIAYWPGDAAEFWSSVGTTPEAELARYDAVIHLRTPPIEN